jgi:hypothetical protein
MYIESRECYHTVAFLGAKKMDKLSIQFIAADPYEDQPDARLKLTLEYRDMKERVLASAALKHEMFDAPAARLKDVINELQRNRPNCVHFSCHGTQFSRIVLLNENNGPEPLSHVTIARLFNALTGRIRLVTLSCCYSAEQASRIAEFIDCVVGIEGVVGAEAAAEYSKRFYGELAKGKSVAEAHRLALPEFANKNPEGRPEPIVYPRTGVDPEKLFPGRPAPKGPGFSPAIRRSEAYRTAKEAFEKNCDRYGIWAEELIVRKSVLMDGSAAVSYRIEKLCCSMQNIRRVYFDYQSTAGLVNEPEVDLERGGLPFEWKATPFRDLKTFKKMVEKMTTARGHFTGNLEFKCGRNGKRDSYSFGWTVPVLNSDAVTSWEYNNLYSEDKQIHIDRSPLPRPPLPPQEYFAVLVWFPVRKLTIHLNVPQPAKTHPSFAVIKPRSRMFRLKRAKERIPLIDVRQKEVLYMRPNPNVAWNKTNLRWEPFPNDSKFLQPLLQNRPDGTSILSMEFPLLGSYASLDWDMVQLKANDRLDTLIRQTDHFQDELLKHRAARIRKRRAAQNKSMQDMLGELHSRLWAQYDKNNPGTHFETTLVVWNAKDHQLQMVEGFVNGKAIPAGSNAWRFWLPFGLGLGGNCFRTADAQAYRRPLDTSQASRKQNYLPYPKSMKHECLISLPLDHPDFLEADLPTLGPFRSRQLVGVLTLGSTFKASGLCILCEGEETSQIKQHIQDLHKLREDCQATCDKICNLILPRNV